MSRITPSLVLPPGDWWLKVSEIAHELRVAPSAVRSLIDAGLLKAVRAGKRAYRVRHSEFVAYLRRRGLTINEEVPNVQ